jgi:hypothetical protein
MVGSIPTTSLVFFTLICKETILSHKVLMTKPDLKDCYLYIDMTSNECKDFLLKTELNQDLSYDQKYEIFNRVAYSRVYDIIGCSYMLKRPTDFIVQCVRLGYAGTSYTDFYVPSVDLSLPKIILGMDPSYF